MKSKYIENFIPGIIKGEHQCFAFKMLSLRFCFVLMHSEF